MRAIENHRWILRSTNTGVTAAIDPRGRVTMAAPRHRRTSLHVAFGYEHDITFYAAHGDLFAYLCALITTLAWASACWPATPAAINGLAEKKSWKRPASSGNMSREVRHGLDWLRPCRDPEGDRLGAIHALPLVRGTSIPRMPSLTTRPGNRSDEILEDFPALTVQTVQALIAFAHARRGVGWPGRRSRESAVN